MNSSFYMEGYTNISDACKRYAKDIPGIYDCPFLQSELKTYRTIIRTLYW